MTNVRPHPMTKVTAGTANQNRRERSSAQRAVRRARPVSSTRSVSNLPSLPCARRHGAALGVPMRRTGCGHGRRRNQMPPGPRRSRKTRPKRCPVMAPAIRDTLRRPAGGNRVRGRQGTGAARWPEDSLSSALHTHALCMRMQRRHGERPPTARQLEPAAHRPHLAAHTLHQHAYAALSRPREKHPRNSYLRRGGQHESAGHSVAHLHENARNQGN